MLSLPLTLTLSLTSNKHWFLQTPDVHAFIFTHTHYCIYLLLNFVASITFKCVLVVSVVLSANLNCTACFIILIWLQLGVNSVYQSNVIFYSVATLIAPAQTLMRYNVKFKDGFKLNITNFSSYLVVANRLFVYNFFGRTRNSFQNF